MLYPTELQAQSLRKVGDSNPRNLLRFVRFPSVCLQPLDQLSISERKGFEPLVPLPVQHLSRVPDSTTLAPLHEIKNIRRERDSNPRRLAPQRFSRPPPSTTRTSLQIESILYTLIIIMSIFLCWNHGVYGVT